MPTPPPDPNGQPPAAKRAAAPSSADPRAEAPQPAGGSTHSHRPSEPLSDLLKSSGASRRPPSESDIAQFLANPQGVANTDDAPTVITHNNPNNAQPPAPVAPPVTSEPPSIAGRRLGNYELIEAIGAGGMAAVLRARDLELGRIVALKILPPEAARDPEGVTRFKQEARAAARLDHENVARVYACGEDQGLHFIAFEFVEGDNLRVVIDHRGPLPAAECVRYMMQVAAGLRHAAERGVVHRDIKPSNILITPDGRAKIVDMGLARHLGSESINGGVTQSGVTLGTFDYISPEQALDPRRADVRSDIYSLGCTFYHALTGRPPVPEGTAARKLQAHQHDPPLDPRELNPAIPDELAAILALMMAKDPARRYQSPTELIAHLKGLAERLKVTDAVLHDSTIHAVPADLRLLPEAPRFRPAWMLAVAAAAVAVAAFVAFTANPGPAPAPPPGDQPKAKSDPFAKGGLPPNPNTAVPAAVPVRTVEELVQRLEDPNTTRVELAAGTFDLTKRPEGVVFQGEKLELVGASGGGTRLVVTAQAQRGAAGSLTVKAGTFTVRGVWFDIQEDADADAPGPGQPAGLRIEDATSVELTDCVFATSDALRAREPQSVAVSRVAAAKQVVRATCCLFAPGTVGLLVPAGADVSIDDSGFAPHAAAIQVEANGNGAEPTPRAEVKLAHCSFMLDRGGAAVEAGAPTNVTAADCVFAPVNGAAAVPFLTSEARRGVVIRLRSEKTEGVQLRSPPGRANAYFNVDPLGTASASFTFEECKTVAPAVEDRGHVELRQPPWATAEPLKAAASESPWKAFALRVSTDRLLFTADKPPVPLGVAFHNPSDNVRRAYPDLWPPSRPKSAEVKTKVWWPDAPPEEQSPTVSPSLAALLDGVRPGDEILIRHTGPLPLGSVELKPATRPSEGEFRVTFRPDPGSRPVLTVDNDPDRDQTLFKLKGGEVTFDGVHFLLKPNRPKDGQLVAAVAVIGGKACTFRNCVFTLLEEDDSQVAAVHLPDIDKVMAMDQTARPVPKLRFANCVIRGKGRGVWVPVSRPFDLEVTNSLTAIDGPLLLTRAGGKAVPGGHGTAKFTRLTALVAGPLVEMHAAETGDLMKNAGVVPVRVEADECLFAAVPSAGRPLIDLDGVDPDDVKNRVVLNWQTARGNRYANFDERATFALIRPPGGESTPKEWDSARWIDYAGEPPAAGKPLGAVKFEKEPEGLRDLAAVRPADLAVTTTDFPAGKPDAGADLKALPALPDEPKPE
jgi:serine/threonine protein kinase